MRRRDLVQALASTALPSVGLRAPSAAEPADDARTLLRRGGGLVVALRHALAPGTYDPDGFRLDACSTQRNLSAAGRDQARRVGAWFRAAGLAPVAVRSSQWCRCLETARLAFGMAQAWPALNSIARGQGDARAQSAAAQAELARLAAANAPGFEVWVTHQANIIDLVQRPVGPGQALLLRHRAQDGVVVVAGLRIS